jgi:hypothetical protein
MDFCFFAVVLGQRRSHPDAAVHDHPFTGKSNMEKTTAIISALIVLLATGLAAQGSTNTVSPSAPQRSPLDVTYIANEGFLIQAGGKKVLVDALFNDEFFFTPSPELLAQMTRGSGSFADVNLLKCSPFARQICG